jgi:predicted dehydrogenase
MALLKIGLFGCGRIATRHVKAVLGSGAAEIVALADPAAGARAELKAAFPAIAGAAEFDDHPALLAAGVIDAALIFSPHHLHHPQAIDCLAAGVHVMVEKPLALNSAQAREIIGARDHSGKVVLLAYQRRYLSGYRWVAEAIAGGAIGDLQFVSARQTEAWHDFTRDTWRWQPEISGGGHLFDSGSHLIDFVLHAANDPLVAVSGTYSNLDLPVEILAAATLEFAGGAIGNLSFVGNTVGRTSDSVTFYGSTGRIELQTDNYGGVLVPTVARFDNEDRRALLEDFPDPAEPVLNLIAAAEGREAAWCGPEDGLRVLEFIEALRRSAASGRREQPG